MLPVCTDVLRTTGDNVIQGITVKGGGVYYGTSKSAIRIDGNNVILRDSRVIDNADYGVYLRTGNNILVERVLFQNNHLAIQNVNAKMTGVVIRHNTLVNNGIGINLLEGVTPRIEFNIITGSSFCAIYEFNWNTYEIGRPSRGFALGRHEESGARGCCRVLQRSLFCIQDSVRRPHLPHP